MSTASTRLDSTPIIETVSPLLVVHDIVTEVITRELPEATVASDAPTPVQPVESHVSNTAQSVAPPVSQPVAEQLTAPRNTHSIITRGKNNISKPNKKFANNILVSQSETEPTMVTQALKDGRWRNAMGEEFNAQLKNHTWSLFPPSPTYNLIGSKWVFRIKRLSNGSIERFKARLVAKGFH